MDEDSNHNPEKSRGFPDFSEYSHLGAEHLWMRDPKYKDILEKSEIGNPEAMCWFASLATIISTIKMEETAVSLERVLDVFANYDPEHLTKANALLPEDEKVRGLDMLPPFIDIKEGGVRVSWLFDRRIDNTLKLINAMFARENMGIKLGHFDLEQKIRDEYRRKTVREKMIKNVGSMGELYTKMGMRRVNLMLIDLIECYARTGTGMMLDLRIAEKNEITGHSVAITGVVKVPNLESAVIINDPAQRDPYFLLEGNVAEFFMGQRIPMRDESGASRGMVYHDFTTQPILVSPDNN